MTDLKPTTTAKKSTPTTVPETLATTPKTPTLREQESVATLRTLFHVAKADGKVEPRELEALKAGIEGVHLPAGVTLDSLLMETVELDAQLALITTPGAGERVFQSALAVAHAGNLSASKVDPKTRAVLDTIRTKFNIAPEREKLLSGLWSETKDTVLLSNIAPIEDPAKRATEVDKDVMKYSVMSAVLGSFPVPGLAIATDLGVVALQVKLVRDIGQYWGHTMNREAATSLLGGLGLGTGMRIAVTNLAKLVPGWGSVVGGTASFASTWALGKVATKYFEAGMKTDLGTLKAEFQSAKEAGRDAYAAQSGMIDAKRKATSERLEALGADLQSGKLTRAEYEAKVSALA